MLSLRHVSVGLALCPTGWQPVYHVLLCVVLVGAGETIEEFGQDITEIDAAVRCRVCL